MAQVRVNVGVVRYEARGSRNRLAFAGQVIEVSEEEAARLRKLGAVLSDEAPDDPPAGVDDESDEDESDDTDEVPEVDVEVGAGKPLPRPGNTATHARWVAYAVSRGMPEAEAQELTRAKLQAAFPED